jgi:mRNA interferase RelE/StbE
MDLYRIYWKNSVTHDLRKIPSTSVKNIFAAIENLSRNPRPTHCKKLVQTDKTYRIRVGDYRIVYQLDDVGKIIQIDYVRHRSDAYR